MAKHQKVQSAKDGELSIGCLICVITGGGASRGSCRVAEDVYTSESVLSWCIDVLLSILRGRRGVRQEVGQVLNATV